MIIDFYLKQNGGGGGSDPAVLAGLNAHIGNPAPYSTPSAALAALQYPQVLEPGATTVRKSADATDNVASNDLLKIWGSDDKLYTVAQWNALFVAAGYDHTAMTVTPKGYAWTQRDGSVVKMTWENFQGQLAKLDGSALDTAASLPHSPYSTMMAITAADSGTDAINGGAFSDSGLTSIRLSKQLTGIGDRAFQSTPLTGITLPKTLTSIGYSAFRDCDSFRKVALPSTVEEIGPFAFAYCEDLKTVTIPDNVETVSYGAFFHCGDLEQVSLKSGVAAIGDFAFAQCKKLLKAEIPQSVTEMGQDVFTVGKASAIDENDMVQLSAPLSQPAKLQIYGRPDTEASDYADRYGIPFVIQKIVATSVTIAEGKSATLYVGHPMQLTAIQKPANAETKVKWTSSSSAVAVSSSGLVTPKRAGKAVITARTENGKKATITIKVIDAKSVKIDQGKSATLKVGQTLQLTATVSPAQVTSKLTWSSGSKKIATVSSTGLVKALKKGNVTITVKTGNGKKAKIKIKVTN